MLNDKSVEYWKSGSSRCGAGATLGGSMEEGHVNRSSGTFQLSEWGPESSWRTLERIRETWGGPRWHIICNIITHNIRMWPIWGPFSHHYPNIKWTCGCGKSFNIWLLWTTLAMSSRKACGSLLKKNHVTVTCLRFIVHACLMRKRKWCILKMKKKERKEISKLMPFIDNLLYRG